MARALALCALVVRCAVHLHGAPIAIAIAAEAESSAVACSEHAPIAHMADKPGADARLSEQIVSPFVTASCRYELVEDLAFVIWPERERSGLNGIGQSAGDGIDIVQRRLGENSYRRPITKNHNKLLRIWKSNCWIGVGSASPGTTTEKGVSYNVFNDRRAFPIIVKSESERKKNFIVGPIKSLPFVKIVRDDLGDEVWPIKGSVGDLSGFLLYAGLFVSNTYLFTTDLGLAQAYPDLTEREYNNSDVGPFNVADLNVSGHFGKPSDNHLESDTRRLGNPSLKSRFSSGSV